VVITDALLVAVDGELALAHDAAGVVGEHVDARVALEQRRGERADVVELREVGQQVVRAELGGDGRGLLGRAPDDDHGVARGAQLPRGRRPDPVARAGDDDGSACHATPPV
jgi:hypothetical protein